MNAHLNMSVCFSQSVTGPVVYHIIGDIPDHLSALRALIDTVLNFCRCCHEITSLLKLPTP
jgi:hypothetical protein